MDGDIGSMLTALDHSYYAVINRRFFRYVRRLLCCVAPTRPIAISACRPTRNGLSRGSSADSYHSIMDGAKLGFWR